jgi:hypothetical protein
LPFQKLKRIVVSLKRYTGRTVKVDLPSVEFENFSVKVLSVFADVGGDEGYYIAA